MKQDGGRVSGFVNYEEFEDYMDRMVGLLPGKVFTFVNFISSNPRLIS